ncbi:MAG: ATP-binding protein, partial [Mariprofundaceae bacterium]|nr:ATP-binding protein [Mariprofundaceae bacterium]
MSSLRKRLSLSLAGSLALFFIAQTLMIGNAVEDLNERNLISRLNHDQEQILAALEWDPPAAPRLQQSLIPGIYQRPFSGHYFQIDVAGQQLRSRSLWDENIPPFSRTIERNIPGPRDQQLLAVQHRIIMHGQRIIVRTAENIAPMKKATAGFERYMLLFAAGAVLTLMILQGWFINHTLKPLQRIRREINRLQSGELRQIESSAPDEIMPLVNEINHLIHLTQQRLKRSRHALGDLAHSLKTPLAVARQITEQQTTSKSSSQLGEQLSRIEHRIDRELVRARTAGRMPGGQWQHPEQDIQDIVTMLGKVFPQIACSLQLGKGMSIP